MLLIVLIPLKMIFKADKNNKAIKKNSDFPDALSGGILYIIARAVTLVLAFTSLRDLPPGAYETVHWTTIIPHV